MKGRKHKPRLDRIKFRPGISANRLEELAQERGISMTGLLRILISQAKMPVRKDVRKIKAQMTGIGKKIIELAPHGDIEIITGVAEYAIKTARPITDMEREPYDKKNAPSRKLIFNSQGKAMTFYPMEEGGKLMALAAATGMTRNEVLRTLILGIQLPNRELIQARAKISQTGALCKHIALSYMAKGWKPLYMAGLELQKIARETGKADGNNSDETD